MTCFIARLTGFLVLHADDEGEASRVARDYAQCLSEGDYFAVDDIAQCKDIAVRLRSVELAVYDPGRSRRRRSGTEEDT